MTLLLTQKLTTTFNSIVDWVYGLISMSAKGWTNLEIFKKAQLTLEIVFLN